MYKCKTGILEMTLCIHVSVVVGGMLNYKSSHFSNDPLRLCLCSFIGYVEIQDWEFWQRAFVCMFVLL